MLNPFSEAALVLINKRDRWAKLIAARNWIEEYYDSDEVVVHFASKVAGACVGYNDAMLTIAEMAGSPGKAQLLSWIDSQLGELERSAR